MGGFLVMAMAPSSAIQEVFIFAIATAISVAAAGATAGVWQGQPSIPVPNSRQEEMARELAKHKRRNPDRVERLIEQLDEDEVIELETLLASRRNDIPF
jgi:hypothetical protein